MTFAMHLGMCELQVMAEFLEGNLDEIWVTVT
jgi:hypothetical protein